ncbi:MetQ/NlpA family ABC transporter substrate-binding protein [Collinsella tanakaei]|uniref:MetQ/NlpA family ABC transporter substrate-binding protein n=1 Tax=Collinsella tanakaei TaxID=626935 RepID=UPI0025A49151|nr:MetQ/NlpA family ABC transporter substrate-binding protein [Collinsella tanakaei]MDM8300765.1 MetQ/NlpA family ABC transporter substrate-binding protein [Collinsella tanakaei]
MNNIASSQITRRRALQIAAGLSLAGLAGLAGCGSEDAGEQAAGSTAGATKLTVAASPSPHAEILNDYAKPLLAEQGIELEVKEYTDYIIPNQVTSSGEVDANYFQHINYLNNYNEENGTDLVNAGSIHFEPMGVFSNTLGDIADVADGAKVSVPNDPTNEGRALLLLQDLGLITLAEDAGITAAKNDIVDNPHNLDIIEQEAAMLPSTLADVDLSVINGNYAIDAGLSLKDAIASEDPQSEVIQTEYANVICTTPDREDNEAIRALVAVLTTDDFKAYLDETYDGAVLAAF